MKLLDLIGAHWNIWGLDDPTFGRIPAIGLLFVPLCVLSYLPWGCEENPTGSLGSRLRFGIFGVECPPIRGEELRARRAGKRHIFLTSS